MMARYAVMDGIRVINAILAEDKKTAEAVTGKECIEVPDYVSNGYVLVNGEFFKEHILGKNSDIKFLEHINPTGSDLELPVVEGYVRYDEMQSLIAEEDKKDEIILNELN
jgi:hypothetical protein